MKNLRQKINILYLSEAIKRQLSTKISDNLLTEAIYSEQSFFYFLDLFFK